MTRLELKITEIAREKLKELLKDKPETAIRLFMDGIG